MCCCASYFLDESMRERLAECVEWAVIGGTIEPIAITDGWMERQKHDHFSQTFPSMNVAATPVQKFSTDCDLTMQSHTSSNVLAISSQSKHTAHVGAAANPLTSQPMENTPSSFFDINCEHLGHDVIIIRMQKKSTNKQNRNDEFRKHCFYFIFFLVKLFCARRRQQMLVSLLDSSH